MSAEDFYDVSTFDQIPQSSYYSHFWSSLYQTSNRYNNILANEATIFPSPNCYLQPTRPLFVLNDDAAVSSFSKNRNNNKKGKGGGCTATVVTRTTTTSDSAASSGAEEDRPSKKKARVDPVTANQSTDDMSGGPIGVATTTTTINNSSNKDKSQEHQHQKAATATSSPATEDAELTDADEENEEADDSCADGAEDPTEAADMDVCAASPAVPSHPYICGNIFDTVAFDDCPHTIVACQAPVPAQFEGFWQTIFQYEVPLIVMLTKEVENGMHKADRYWPSAVGESVTFPNTQITVTFAQETVMPELEIIDRRFRVSIETSCGPEEHICRQLHYTGWPDFGVPSERHSVDLLVAECEAVDDSTGPIFVHCSAGIGRTGTLMGIYYARHYFRVESHAAALLAEATGTTQQQNKHNGNNGGDCGTPPPPSSLEAPRLAEFTSMDLARQPSPTPQASPLPTAITALGSPLSSSTLALTGEQARALLLAGLGASTMVPQKNNNNTSSLMPVTSAGGGAVATSKSSVFGDGSLRGSFASPKASGVPSNFSSLNRKGLCIVKARKAVLDIVKRMKLTRTGMVQRQEQLAFIFACLGLSGDSPVQPSPTSENRKATN